MNRTLSLIFAMGSLVPVALVNAVATASTNAVAATPVNALATAPASSMAAELAEGQHCQSPNMTQLRQQLERADFVQEAVERRRAMVGRLCNLRALNQITDFVDLSDGEIPSEEYRIGIAELILESMTRFIDYGSYPRVRQTLISGLLPKMVTPEQSLDFRRFALSSAGSCRDVRDLLRNWERNHSWWFQHELQQMVYREGCSLIHHFRRYPMH